MTSCRFNLEPKRWIYITPIHPTGRSCCRWRTLLQSIDKLSESDATCWMVCLLLSFSARGRTASDWMQCANPWFDRSARWQTEDSFSSLHCASTPVVTQCFCTFSQFESFDLEYEWSKQVSVILSSFRLYHRSVSRFRRSSTVLVKNLPPAYTEVRRWCEEKLDKLSMFLRS